MRSSKVNFWFYGAVALLAAGAGARGAVVELRDQACTAGPQVRLGDVADLRGTAALALADTVVAQFEAQHDRANVALGDVERTLTARGVNWGKLTLCGHGTCVVTRNTIADTGPDSSSIVLPAVVPAAAMQGAGADIPAAPAADTLRAQAVAKIEQMTGAGAGDLKVIFSPTDEKALAQSLGGDRVEATSDAADTSSRVPLVLRRYRDEHLVATYRVAADVARRYTAVVAVRDVARGDIISAGDVELRPVFVDSAQGRPATALDAVVGRTSSCLLRAGAVVFEHEAVPAVAVHRGDLITVRAIYGELVVTTIGRALQDGATDQVVPVRHEPSHKVLAVRLTADGEGVMVAEMSQVPAGESKDKPAGGSR